MHAAIGCRIVSAVERGLVSRAKRKKKMSLANLTDDQLSDAQKTELERIIVEALKLKNEYGDLNSTPTGCYLEYGRHPRGYKATEFLGCTKYGPEKRVVHVTSELLELLGAELDNRKKIVAKLAKKTAEVEAAKAGGFASVSAFKKSERERKAVLAAQAEEKAVQDAQADEADWLKFVTEVLQEKDYAFTPAEGVEKVLNKIADGEGVGAAWNNGDFDGDLKAFARCVLGAADRHENSNYDSLLRSGYNREDALYLRERL